MIDGVDHIYDQNLGGLLDLSYGMTTLRIFKRFKSGDVINTKDLSRNERIALMSKLNSKYHSVPLDTNMQVGFVVTQGAVVKSGNKSMDVWDSSEISPPSTTDPEIDKDPKTNPLRNYQPFYISTPITTVRLKGRLTHSQLFESNAKLQNLISDELKLLVEELDTLLRETATKFGVKLDKEGSPVKSESLQAYEKYLKLTGASDSERDLLRKGNVSKSFLGFGLKVGGIGGSYIHFARF